MIIPRDSNLGNQLFIALCNRCHEAGITLFDMQSWIWYNNINIKLIYNIDPIWDTRLRFVTGLELPDVVEEQTQILLTLL